MTCPNQITLRNKTTGEWIAVPCNKKDCTPCNQRKIDRIVMETDLYKKYDNVESLYTLLITYADEHLPRNPINGLPELNKKEIKTLQDNAKRFQRRAWKKLKVKTEAFNRMHPTQQRKIKPYKEVKFEIAGEYAPDSKRPHYHGLMMNAMPELVEHLQYKLNQNRQIQSLSPLWQKGTITARPVKGNEEAALRYIAKYITKAGSHQYTAKNNLQKEFFSKPRGLTKTYVEKTKAYHQDRITPQIKTGYKKIGYIGTRPVTTAKFRNMTRLMRKKIFTPEQNEQITTELIEKSNTAIAKQLEELKSLGYKNPAQELRAREKAQAEMIKRKSHARKQHA